MIFSILEIDCLKTRLSLILSQVDKLLQKNQGADPEKAKDNCTIFLFLFCRKIIYGWL